ncbi:hypothetical protein ES332_D03G120200v1 [Gossypium tomentosum]|uniref:RNase H type-1 domain-containing protein n=1 Tax=Gossypium tomentosum TaxID=34277 RepID=A0A5D2LNT4_GOSTO|nr:hypothetical protein ES332_D03G120200v1 [Gossypium tomentosum]
MQPDCLLACVMKAKYFPKGNFMNAGLGTYPSYTWRSILGARYILEEGMGWRIGNGESVNIWNDKWLSGPGNGKIECQNIDIRYTRISDLINKEENTWNQEVICTLFGEKQWQDIASIPLVSSRLQDTLVWRGDNSRVYTEKSGYRWLITEGLWELKIPSKICILIWRIVNGRSLVRNTVCPVCQVEEESVLRGLGVTSIRDCKLRAITYWAIWHNRNKSYHEGVRETATEVAGFIKAYDIEISATRERLASLCDGRILTWEPPDNDTIKINFDASFNQSANFSTTGIIAQNKDGLIMAAGTYSWKNIADPVMAEARACLQAVILAEEMGFQDVCFEGDALTIIRKLRATDEDKSCIRSLIKRLRKKGRRFRRLSFKHIPREANKVAHAMAKYGERYEHPQFWIEEAPLAIEFLVNQERRDNSHSGMWERTSPGLR